MSNLSMSRGHDAWVNDGLETNVLEYAGDLARALVGARRTQLSPHSKNFLLLNMELELTF